MIKPVLSNETFMADIDQVADDLEHLHLWWLGQSGFLVQWQGAYLLTDPYLSDSLTKKYANTNKPHVRMTERVISPEKLDFIHVVTSSHNHTDHLDGETLRPLMHANSELVILVPEANRDFAAGRLEVLPERLTGITCESPRQIGPFTFHAVPSAHETLETDELGRHRFIGLVIQAGPWTIYHSGDTVRYPGMAQGLQRWPIDIALLPINGRDPERGVAGNLSGPEAVELARDIQARYVLPCHYEMFEFNTVSPAAFRQAAERSRQPYHILKCGERWSLKK